MAIRRVTGLLLGAVRMLFWSSFFPGVLSRPFRPPRVVAQALVPALATMGLVDVGHNTVPMSVKFGSSGAMSILIARKPQHERLGRFPHDVDECWHSNGLFLGRWPRFGHRSWQEARPGEGVLGDQPRLSYIARYLKLPSKNPLSKA